MRAQRRSFLTVIIEKIIVVSFLSFSWLNYLKKAFFCFFFFDNFEKIILLIAELYKKVDKIRLVRLQLGSSGD